MSIIAVSRSNLGGDDVTSYLDSWAIELVSYSRGLGHTVVDIYGNDVTYDRMSKILSETKPEVLFNFSHGCKTYLIGNDMRCTLTRGQADADSCGTCDRESNLRTVKDMAVLAFSCHSAYQLGKCAIAYGSPVYVGWSDYLIIVTDQYGTQNIFKNTLIPIAKRVLHGWKIGDAVEAGKADMKHEAKEFKPVKLISVPLMYDRRYLTLHGNPDWKIRS